VVQVVYDPAKWIDLETLLRVFWEAHDPTQGMRQGNDVGSQYRSALYTTGDAQLSTARRSRDVYQAALTQAGRGQITTEIEPLEVLLPGGGVPPAVPAQEPGRLLRPEGDRRQLSDRLRRGRPMAAKRFRGWPNRQLPGKAPRKPGGNPAVVPLHEADMATVPGHLEAYCIGWSRQAREQSCRHEGVVVGMQYQRGQFDLAEQAPGGGALIVVRGIAKAVQRGGNRIVVPAQAVDAGQCSPIQCKGQLTPGQLAALPCA
jgi:hypothetical protein